MWGGVLVVASAARPWLVELVSGAPLEEAIRPGLMMLCVMQAAITLAILYPFALARSSPRTPPRQPKSTTAIQGALGGSVLFHVVAVLYGAPVVACVLHQHEDIIKRIVPNSWSP